MTTHKTAGLEGALLDAAVAKAEGLCHDPRSEMVWIPAGKVFHTDVTVDWFPYRPSEKWFLAGPIIERERICVSPFDPGIWAAFMQTPGVDGGRLHGGSHPLIAAMRAYVASKFGEEVELP